MKCPSCHFEQPEANTTCEGCGLIFAKYHPEGIVTGDTARKLREQEETPENGWTIHHIGGYTWRSGPTHITLHSPIGDEKVNPKSLETRVLLTFIFIYVIGFFIGFYFLAKYHDEKLMFNMFEGFGLLYGFQLFVLSFFKLSQKRLMENIPFSTIQAMAPGQVEISGYAAGTASLQTPFTQKPCVYYEYLIEQLMTTNNGAQWITVERGGSQKTPFTVADSTGKVLIQPNDAETQFSSFYSLVTYAGKGLPEPIHAFLEGGGMSGMLDRTLRFTERHFQEGQRIFVMGICQQKAGLGEEDGFFLGRGSWPEDLFIISDKSREKLEKQFNHDALVYILFGLGLIGVSLYFFLHGIVKAS